MEVSGGRQLRGPNSDWVTVNYRRTRQGQTPCQFRCLFVHVSPLLGNEKQSACHSPLCSSGETEKDKEDRDPWLGRGEGKPRGLVGGWDGEEEAVRTVRERGCVQRGSAEGGHPFPGCACVRVRVCVHKTPGRCQPWGWEPPKATRHQGINAL